MNFQHSEADTRRLSKSIINLQDRYPSSIVDMSSRRTVKTATTSITKSSLVPPCASSKPDRKKMELNRSSSQGISKRLLNMSYFSLESLLLLVCLTASLLILPLVLPPLPPPPFMLLLIPIGILALLMILAFMPCNSRDFSYAYV